MPSKQKKVKNVPHIDYDRCTGRGVCVEVCPEDIFEIRNLAQIEFCEETKTAGLCPEPEYATKTLRSYPVNINDCTECGVCIEKCPEKAITLIPRNCVK